jgi:hypothetical protein
MLQQYLWSLTYQSLTVVESVKVTKQRALNVPFLSIVTANVVALLSWMLAAYVMEIALHVLVA